jgi:hypothetical protein
LLVVLGVAQTCGCAQAEGPGAARPPGWDARTVWVAADRDGDALIELDLDLFVVGRRALESPLVVRAAGGALWVVHAPAGSPEPPLALRRWGEGGPGPPAAVGEVLALEVDGAGRALLLERAGDGDVRLLRFDAAGEVCDLQAPQEGRALALGTAGPALALGDAGWAEAGPDGSWRRRTGFEGAVVLDLAARTGGGWWTLAWIPGETEALCIAHDSDGVPREVRDVGAARRLARGRGPPWVWAVDARAVRAPLAAAGRVVELPLAGARAALADGRGGLVVAAAGALLRLDARGAARPGQGGFARLVDLECLASGP